MPITRRLKSPLFTDWSEQHVRLALPEVGLGAPLRLTVNGQPTDFQYTGLASEVMVRLGLAKGEEKLLEFRPASTSATDLSRPEIMLADGATIGVAGREVAIPAMGGPFGGFAGFSFTSTIHCEAALESTTLHRTNAGPLFTDYELRYQFAERRHYSLRFRCYRAEPYVEVSEQFALGMNAELVWTLNPARELTHILGRDSFEGESQPTVEPLGAKHPRDLLCRLQMPVLSEYFIPNNRGWFAFFDSRHEARGMFGILGLYGARWEQPVANMPEIFDRDGSVEWHASLASGARHWLLYAGPVEKEFTPQRRFVFHRLDAEFNRLRLDEQFDLTGETLADAACWNEPGFFVGDDFHQQAQQRLPALTCLQRVIAEAPGQTTFAALIDPTPEKHRVLYDQLIAQFEKWVRQFQGWRTGQNDYLKNTIGFSRTLRTMLITYELLRKDRAITEEQARRLGAYFVFAARRIRDEGRWPHSKTWLHPDHPESVRDVYTYGGEHKPDRLVWTNSLPNFQSDPLCALAQLSALFKDHPDAVQWRNFALDDIERQLTAYCGRSGAWEESINYALYTFCYFVITFRAVKYRWGIDYFNDERVRRVAGWLCRFFGPYDKRFDAYTWPSIGNAVHPALGGSYLLAYAGELAPDDPLRHDCLAIFQLQERVMTLAGDAPCLLAAMPPALDRPYTLRPAGSEWMDELGVSLRLRHLQPDESYLFQKIGFVKDHYENDESAFNWYAKGTPFCMDYGTYTGDVSPGGAHNLVEIPDMDALRRGYLAQHLFTPVVDYTRSEMPVTLKLLWGRVRSFAEVDDKDGTYDRSVTPYHYIGDNSPVGPKTWKVRLLLFVKPDYIVLFDRVYGAVPHRYNLHFTGDDVRREGNIITARGRYDLDLLAYVQHPAEFEFETGELTPKCQAADQLKHRQSYFRLSNRQDGIYRTVIFAQERGREVRIESLGSAGVKVTTAAYTDHVYLHNDMMVEPGFTGRAGWIRRCANGQVQACVPDGEQIQGFGKVVIGRGPWTYNLDGRGTVVLEGAPREVVVRPAG